MDRLAMCARCLFCCDTDLTNLVVPESANQTRQNMMWTDYLLKAKSRTSSVTITVALWK